MAETNNTGPLGLFLCQKKAKELIPYILFFSPQIVFAQNDSTTYPGIDSNLYSLNIPTFHTGGNESESESGAQEHSSLLQSSRDTYVSFSVFQFGAGRFQMRAYSPKNQTVLFN